MKREEWRGMIQEKALSRQESNQREVAPSTAEDHQGPIWTGAKLGNPWFSQSRHLPPASAPHDEERLCARYFLLFIQSI